MASENRTSNTDIISALTDCSGHFSFFQALRLLRHTTQNETSFETQVHTRPNLSLAFPNNDLECITRREDGHYEVVANFFGLYGVTSPLPTFYTEDLIEEACNERHASRDFLDILHQALYPLLFRTWEKHRLWLTIDELNNEERLDQLYALIGLTVPQDRLPLPEVRRLLAFAGILSQQPRSALGLETVLRGLLDGITVSITQCVPRRLDLSLNDQLWLGQQACLLGEEAVLGGWIDDISGSADIAIHPIDIATFQSLLPGGKRYDTVRAWVAFYQPAPISYSLTLTLDPGMARPTVLGDDWNRLGLDSWLLSDGSCAEVTIQVPLT